VLSFEHRNVDCPTYMPRKMRVRELFGDELSFLERTSKGKDYKAKMRAEMVLLGSKEGLSARKIATRLNLHRHTVEERIARFNESGIEGLMRDIPSPGRPHEITDQEREAIFKTALSKPNKLGLPYVTWSSSKLRNYLVQNGLVRKISSDWVRQLLQKRGSNSPKQGSGW
jgi:transposase